MKKSYQIIITISLVIIAVCLLYTTYHNYQAIENTKKVLKGEEKGVEQTVDNGRLTPEQQRMLEYEVRIYELQQEIERLKNNQQ